METLSDAEIQRVAEAYKNSPNEIGLGHVFRVLLGTKARE